MMRDGDRTECAWRNGRSYARITRQLPGHGGRALENVLSKGWSSVKSATVAHEIRTSTGRRSLVSACHHHDPIRPARAALAASSHRNRTEARRDECHKWCADWQDKYYYSRSPERNPAGPDQAVRRASRGGSWRHVDTMCRVTLRSKLDPSFRYNDYGFRVARSL
jgi:hypothetical protein